MNEELLTGAVPMVAMAQSAAKWRNRHAHARGSHACTHTVTSTQLQPPRCTKRQLSHYRIWNRVFILKVPEGGGANRSTRRNLPTACPLIGTRLLIRQESCTETRVSVNVFASSSSRRSSRHVCVMMYYILLVC